VIKYLGSKRRLVPVLSSIAAAARPRTALDLFTGTTRVAQAFKRTGAHVTAVDSARYAHVFAQCYVATDAADVDQSSLVDEIRRLDALPGYPGYVTETFCRKARFFQPHNGERIDAIRDAIATDHPGTVLEPILLTSLIEAADRVDSTTGVQMAYVKRWADRSYRRLELRPPELVDGTGTALLAPAETVVDALPEVDLAYLDPPYNQHRYTANYHLWETLVAWDAPAHYGVACKRVDLRDQPDRSPFNRRHEMPRALAHVLERVRARAVVLSYNDESWVTLDELMALCARRGHVEALAFESTRYVGARIGIHNQLGERVGTVGRLRNREYVLIAGERADVGRLAAAGRASRGSQPLAAALSLDPADTFAV
jgi:adenine-specific DNA-methyltransferase